MPAAKLPTKLQERMDELAARVRKLRVMRAFGRSAFLLPVSALLCVLADAYLGLPTFMRAGLLVGWVVIALREAWGLYRASTAPVDLEAVASAIEVEFPRLAERLTTAVELSEHADQANGSPALINEVIRDADSRARKLELAAAFPSGAPLASCVSAVVLIVAMLIPTVMAPRAGEYLRRFFLPGYVPKKAVPYQVVVKSGDPAVKRGDQVTLTAVVEPTAKDAILPREATLIVTAHGKEERFAMTSDDVAIWHLRRPAVETDFDYRVESGGAVSDTHHVTVVEPITLASAKVAVQPPPYAANGDAQVVAVEGLGELVALEHSTVTFELRFAPHPAAATLEFIPEADPDTRTVRQRHQLKVAEDGSVRLALPVNKSGAFALTAEGAHGVLSEFPRQPLRVLKDLAPKLVRVTGLSDKSRQVRPNEKIAVDVAATDDVALTRIVLEWNVDGGPIQTIPFAGGGLPAAQFEGRAVLSLKERVKPGQKVSCRIAATDNRHLPDVNFKPQTTYFPAADWAEFEVNAAADPLAEQDIAQRKLEIEKKLKEIQAELAAEWRATNALNKETRNRRALDGRDQDRIKKIRNDLAESKGKLEDLSRDTGVIPELTRLSDAMRNLADRELNDADLALNRGRDETRSDARTEQLQKAEESIDAALRKIDELLKENERIAKERLDKRHLEDIAREQQDLADTTKKAEPKDTAELAKKQKELTDELAKLKEQSEALQNASNAVKAEDARKMADDAKRLADEIRELNDSMKRTEKHSAQQRLADLRQKQDELAKKVRQLADRTDAASRAAENKPLNPEDTALAKAALEKGDLNEATRQQEKAARELERLARELEDAAAQSRDAREAARQLARLQEDLRQRLAAETREKPLDQLPAERRAALEKQQEALERAAARLQTPPGDLTTDVLKQQAAADARGAREMLKKGADQGADKKMQEAKDSLEKLASRLPTKEQRLAKAKDEVARLKQQQDSIRQKVDAAARAIEKQDPDAAATQRDLASRLADAAQKQADVAEQLARLDAPGLNARTDKAADAAQRAAADLTAGRPQDSTTSQQAIKREIDRLEQALHGQQPIDDKVAELAKKQRDLAQETERNAVKPDRSTQLDVQRRQGELARELEKLQTPEAATVQAEAVEAARQAEAAGNNPVDPQQLSRKTRAAADKLEQLNDRMNGKESPADAADRLAKKQKANVDEQDKRKDGGSTADARKKAAQVLDELRNTRTGPDAQKARQQAQDALQRAANAVEPNNNARAQRDAADALKDLADKLSRDPIAKGQPKGADPADDAERLAKKQRELTERTRQELEQASQMPGDAGDKARKDALEKAAHAQRDLARQAGELPGRDAPKDRQRVQEAMQRAKDELDKQNFDGATQRQKEAAEALDRVARNGQQRQEDEKITGHPDLPNKAQADAARQLADEQRKLQEDTRQAANELAKENAPRTDNPLEDLARQQQEIARQARDLAKTVNERQGAQAEQSKQAQRAADAAQKTSNQVKNGDLVQAKQSGQHAAESMEQLAQDKSGGESSQKAKELARQQQDVNKKMDEFSKDQSAARAQQASRQQQLENQARDVGAKLEQLAKSSSGMIPGEKGREAADSAKQAGDKLQAARQQSAKGQREEAELSREQSALAMERAARQAGEAAKELTGSDEKGQSPRVGQALGNAQSEMNQAGQKLGQGEPGGAARSMEQAAQSLQQAASQLGSNRGDGPPKPGQGQGGVNPGGNSGGPGGKLDLRSFADDVAQHSGKSWGELPGEIRNKIVQQMKARYGEDYARNIKLYFEQLAERK